MAFGVGRDYRFIVSAAVAGFTPVNRGVARYIVGDARRLRPDV
jgi:hypothetical protein